MWEMVINVLKMLMR